MNNRTRVTEEWIATDRDNRGRPRSFAIVQHEPDQPVVIDGAPIVSPLPAMPARTTSHIEGGPVDRARAFGLETLQLSLVVGVLFVVTALFLGGSTLGLLTLSLIYLGGFCATWLIAYFAHVLRSPEGIELYQTKRLWDFLDREQSQRWQRVGIETPKHRLSTGDRLLLAVFLGVGGLLCILMILSKEGLL